MTENPAPPGVTIERLRDDAPDGAYRNAARDEQVLRITVRGAGRPALPIVFVASGASVIAFGGWAATVAFDGGDVGDAQTVAQIVAWIVTLLAFAGFGPLMLYWGVAGLMNRVTIELGTRRLRASHAPLRRGIPGLPADLDLAAQDVRTITVRMVEGGDGPPLPGIFAETHGGASHRFPFGHMAEADAQWLAAALESHRLGLANAGADDTEDHDRAGT